MSRSEKQKMLAGEFYWANDPELVADRRRCRDLLRAFNDATNEDQRPVLVALLGEIGEDSVIQAPFGCDYGYNIRIGAGSFLNFNSVILDCAPVTIGDKVQIGSAVQLVAADHPREPDLRRTGVEMAAPVTIEDNAWLGSGVIVLPGVTVGKDSVIGAGSVVTRDIPPGVVAVGAPCRVLRALSPDQ